MMKKILKPAKFILSCALLACMAMNPPAALLYAQVGSYSQFFNNPILHNPAFAGSDIGMRVRLNYRDQWRNLPSNYNNYVFSFDVAERNIPGSGGIGLIVQSDFDGIGNIKTTSASFLNSVRIRISENFFTHVGLSASLVNKSVDWSGFVFGDQLDPRYGNINGTNFQPPDFDSMFYPDFGLGIMLRYFESSPNVQNIVGSLAVGTQHVFKPDASFIGMGSRTPVKLTVSGNLLLDNHTHIRHRRQSDHFFDKLNPGFLYEVHGDMSNFLLGINAYKSSLYSGIWVRSQNFTYTNVYDIIVMAGIDIPVGESSRIKLMYSYDYVLSDVRRSLGPTHEISVIFELDTFSFFGELDTQWANRNRGIRQMECPPF